MGTTRTTWYSKQLNGHPNKFQSNNNENMPFTFLITPHGIIASSFVLVHESTFGRCSWLFVRLYSEQLENYSTIRSALDWVERRASSVKRRASSVERRTRTTTNYQLVDPRSLSSSSSSLPQVSVLDCSQSVFDFVWGSIYSYSLIYSSIWAELEELNAPASRRMRFQWSSWHLSSSLFGRTLLYCIGKARLG